MRALLVLSAVALGMGFRAPIGTPITLQDRDDDAGADAKGDAGSPRYQVPACILVKAYARYGAGAYDHIVSIDSACDKLARCEVSTDVNPDPIDVEVPPGETREVVTFRGSPAYEFSANVRCKLESGRRSQGGQGSAEGGTPEYRNTY